MRFKRKRNEWKFLLPFFLLSGLILQSCTDEGIMDAPSWHQAVEQGDNALMRAAKAMVEDTQGEMSMPDMFKTLGKATTRAAESTPQTLSSGSFTINWEAAQSFHEEDGTVLIVPIKMKQNMAIWRFTVINNKRKAEQTPMHSVLYVKKFNSTGYVIGRVLSYAPSRQYIKKHPKYKNEIDWYNPDHTDYSGLLLVSSLEGTLFHGFNYENGHRQYTFRPNIKTHEHDHGTNPITRAITTTDNKITSTQSPVFNMRMLSSTSAISTYSFDNEIYVQPGCVLCGGDPLICDCWEVVVCKTCAKIPENCICICEECERKKPNCICCLVCNSFPCDCNSGSDSGSGSGGGGGGGNNNSSNNGNNNNQNQGGNSSGSGSTSTSPPTITGGTAEQQQIIRSAAQKLLKYGLNLSNVNIQILDNTGCRTTAKILDNYAGIGICQEFFAQQETDYLAILWHEAYHLEHDDRTWKDNDQYHIDGNSVTPPSDIEEAIRYMIEVYYNIPQEIYSEKEGKYMKNPAWEIAYYEDWTWIGEFINPTYTQNEIEAHSAEIKKFPNVSQRYYYERKISLWKHSERLKKMLGQ